MYSYKDFETGKIRHTRGKFSHWAGPTGLMSVPYAIFQNPKGIVAVPRYLLTKETLEQIPPVPPAVSLGTLRKQQKRG